MRTFVREVVQNVTDQAIADGVPEVHFRFHELAGPAGGGVSAGRGSRGSGPSARAPALSIDRVRAEEPVAAPPLAATYTAAVDLERPRLWGAVELSAVIIRKSARCDRGDGFAAFAGARVADAMPSEIRVDGVYAVRGQFLDIRYEDFRRAGADQFPNPDALYQLDCDGETPILWLNSAHARICTSLDSVASIGGVARLRDVAPLGEPVVGHDPHEVLGREPAPDSNAFSRLWWIAELTRDGDSYLLTEQVLERQPLATQLFVRQFSHHRPAVAAFVDVMGDAAAEEIDRVARELNRSLSTLVLEMTDEVEIRGLLRELREGE